MEGQGRRTGHTARRQLGPHGLGFDYGQAADLADHNRAGQGRVVGHETIIGRSSDPSYRAAGAMELCRYQEALRLADEAGLGSITFPAISTGMP